MDELKEFTDQELFPIVYVNMYHINEVFSTHAMVVEKCGIEDIEVLDPVKGQRSVSSGVFERSWRICGNLTIIIQPKT